MRSNVDNIRIFKLILKIKYILDLENTVYVPSFSRNLVSVSIFM